ncbi:anti-sigma-D factor RsdA [Millisia brevis]|uniref:anti-sigma-D factor RsdA n=1 Tax=Millisia brevis TaxID=264148 RepID=UPI00082F4091|nr:anti-sigma-D factor RsdA [Millisia brevis]
MGRGDGRSTDPFADSGEPVEVARVHHDDAFLDAIAGDGRVATESNEEYQLALLFAQWRTEVDREPMPAGPTIDEVLAAIAAQEEKPQPRRESTVLRFLRPVGRVAAAFLIVGGAATVVFSYNAQPGDPLWSIKSVVFSSEASATMAKVDTSSALDAAASSIQARDTTSAATNLSEAVERIEAINNEGDKNAFEERLTTLQAELDALLQAQLAQEQQAATTAPPTTTPSVAAPTTTQAPVTTTPAPVSQPSVGWPTLPTIPTLPSPEDLTLPTIPSIPLPTIPTEVPTDILPTVPAPEPTGGPSLPTLEPAPPVTTTTLPEN